jgi:UPF0755 protein
VRESRDNNSPKWRQNTAVLGDIPNMPFDENKFSDHRKKARNIKQKQSQRTAVHIFGSVLLCAVIICVSALLGYTVVRGALDLTGIAQNEFEAEVEIPKNATVKQIAEILTENNIIGYPEFFILYANAQDSQIYNQGVFTLSSAMTYNAIIEKLQSTSTVRETVSIRIQEGMTASQIGRLLEQNRVCLASDFGKYYKNKLNKFNFEKRVIYSNNKYYQLEGYLFPDTYEFYMLPETDIQYALENKNHYSETESEKQAKIAAETMYDNFNQKFTKELYKTINEMGFNLDEFISLASIVQKEAGTIEDMGLVASVFLNRINNSQNFPYLQSDVTGIYADENIGINNKLNELYDTYLNPGLPPGPICNPGMDAMMAIINAPQTDYLYFCANEETLEVFYAKTITEHEQNLILAGLTEEHEEQ